MTTDHGSVKFTPEVDKVELGGTSIPPRKFVEPPTLPKKGWIQRWKDRRHEKWMAHFLAEFAKPDSLVHQTVLVQANAMARGMVMRHFDDRGIPRCRLCLSTDQLVKRILERKRGPGRRWLEKTIFLCPTHKDVQLPAPKPAPSISVAAPAGST